MQRSDKLPHVDSRVLAGRVAAAALEKKATDVLILDLRKLETMADYFVVCTGTVDQQIRAIVDHIQTQVRVTLGDRVLHREGMETANWVLLDYVDVVVHVFKPSFREFYRLEDLWSDADAIPVTDEQDALAKPRPARRKLAEVKPAAARTAPAKAAAKVESKPKAAKTKPAKPKKAASEKKPAPKTTKTTKTPKKPAASKRIPKILQETAPARKPTRKPKA